MLIHVVTFTFKPSISTSEIDEFQKDFKFFVDQYRTRAMSDTVSTSNATEQRQLCTGCPFPGRSRAPV